MYGETELIFSHFENSSQELHQFDEFCSSPKSNASLGMHSSLIPASIISDYNLGGEGDLFKAPEPVIGEPQLVGIDPVTAAISMISCGENTISPQLLSVSDIESSIENGQLLNEIFYECKKDLLAKEGNSAPLSGVFDIKVPTDVAFVAGATLPDESPLQKGVSLMESVNKVGLRPSFLDFPALDVNTAYAMRRAFSEGDIKALGNGGDKNMIRPPLGQPTIMRGSMSEERMEKLSRYWSKKSKRNFGRKIKYACRKALADNQPRIRGRFARTEETM